MFSDVTAHLNYQMLNAPIRQHPYPHFYSASIFPDAFYSEILRHMPDDGAFQNLIERGQVIVPPALVDTYEQRSVIGLATTHKTERDHIYTIEEGKRTFWAELTNVLTSPEIVTNLIRAFAPWLSARFGEGGRNKHGISD